MSFYSKQRWFCNCCGKPQFSELPKVLGREWKCCSMDCIKEMDHRSTLSIMGKEYYNQAIEVVKPKSKVNPDDCYRMCEYCDGAADCTCPYCHKENK